MLLERPYVDFISPEYHEGGDAAEGPEVGPRAVVDTAASPERLDQLRGQVGERPHQGARVHLP